jgi:hypothetical protein
MSHFIPSFNVTPQKFSDADITAPNFENLSDNDKLVMGLNQNVLATVGSAEAILKASEEQYKAHLSQNAEAIKEQRKQAEKQFDATLALSGVFEQGLGDVSRVISKLSNSFDIKVAALIDQLVISNTKLDELVKLVQIPEFEKERLHYFSQGMNFLKQAINSPKRYKEALNCFHQAYKLNTTDYLVAHQIGLIYLYIEEFLDIKQAEEFFSVAADYGSSAGDKIAAVSYQHLTYSQILQHKLPEAVVSAISGYKIDESLSELKIMEAESHLMLDDEKNACRIVKSLCLKNSDNIPVVLHNPVLSKNFEIIGTVSGIQVKFEDQVEDAIVKLKELKVHMTDNFKVCYMDLSESIFPQLNIEKTEDNVILDNFIDGIVTLSESEEIDVKVDNYNFIELLISVVEKTLDSLKEKYIVRERKPYPFKQAKEVTDFINEGNYDQAISKHDEFMLFHNIKLDEDRKKSRESVKRNQVEANKTKLYCIVFGLICLGIPHLMVLGGLIWFPIITGIISIGIAMKYQDTYEKFKEFWYITGFGGILNIIFLIAHMVVIHV